MYRTFPDGFTVRDLEERGKYPSIPRPKILPSDTVLDLGAHIGAFSYYAVKSGAERVVAVEPIDANWDLFCRNCPTCELIKAAAVGDTEPETLELFLSITTSKCQASRCAKKLQSHGYAGRRPSCIVPAIGIGTLLKGITVLKVDIEGGEYFLNIPSHLTGLRIIAIDFHPIFMVNWKPIALDICDKLEAAGFRPVGNRPDFKSGFRSNGVWIR